MNYGFNSIPDVSCSNLEDQAAVIFGEHLQLLRETAMVASL
jgi:hypothetical protein